MYLDLKRIGVEGVAFDHALPLPELRGETGEPLLVGSARVHGEAARDHQVVELRARLEARVQLACSRCLELFEDYCVVTDSIRHGIPVAVEVVDENGMVLMEQGE